MWAGECYAYAGRCALTLCGMGVVADGRVIHAYGRSGLWQITYPRRVATIASFEGEVLRGRVWKRELAQEDFPATLGIISPVIVLDDLGRGSMFFITLLDGTDSNRFGQSQ